MLAARFDPRLTALLGFDRPTSRPATSSARSKLWRQSATRGKPNTRKWPRSTPLCRRSWRSSSRRLATSNLSRKFSDQCPVACSHHGIADFSTFYLEFLARIRRGGRERMGLPRSQRLAKYLRVAITSSTVRSRTSAVGLEL